MGYISDVAVGVQFLTHEEMVSFVSFMRLHGDKHVVDAINEFAVVDGNPDDYIISRVENGVKWYETFPEVIATKFIVDQAKERGCSTVFIRIGENHDDIEVDSWYGDTISSADNSPSDLWNYFEVVRYIQFPQNTKPLSSMAKTK